MRNVSLTVVLLGAAQHARAPRRSAVGARHREIDARLVNASDAAQVEGAAQLGIEDALSLHTRGVTLGGMNQPFLYGNRRRRTARFVVGTLTCTPRASATCAHNSATVRSFCPRSRRATSDSTATASLPGSRRQLSIFWIKATLTRNCRAS
jgi:hypothetical protein